MPLMTKMREKLALIFGIFAVVFIIYIVLDWGMDITGRKSRSLQRGEALGEINGVEITYQEFNKQLETAIQMVKEQYKIEPDEIQMAQIREEVWNNMVFEIIVKQELSKMGMSVSDKEISDWVNNLPEMLPQQIQRNFIDSTGQINFSFLRQAIESQEPQAKEFWMNVETLLRQERLQSKITSLILSTVRITEGELLQKYNDENNKINGKYVFFDPNLFVQTNEVPVSDDEIKNYYDSHKENYKQEEGRKLKAAIFPVMASKQDTTDVMNIMNKVAEDYKKGIDFKSLIDLHSETKYIDTLFLKHGQIASAELEKKIFESKTDDVIGPILDENTVRMIKIFKSRDSKDQFVRTSQILLKFNPSNKDSVKKFANQLITRIKKGESINELAKQYSEDPSVKQNNGDMGYVGKGQFVKPYEDAMFAGKVGDVVGPVESSYGYHIIKITAKDSRELNIGDIKISISPSSQTKEDIYNNARDFMNLAKDGDFDHEAQLSKAELHETPMFGKTGAIPGIGLNPSVSKFAFKNNVGTISDVYRIGQAYVVFKITDERKEGYRSIEEMKEGIRTILVIQKKLEKMKGIVGDIRNKIAAGDSIEKFTQIDSRLKVTSTGLVTPASSIPGIGRDGKLIGKIFNMDINTISQPIEGTRGYYVFYLYSKTNFDPIDFNSKRNNLYNQLLQEKQNYFFTEWRRVMLEKADIVDNRDKYFR